MAKANKREAGRVVYSSEHGRMCSTCGKPTAKCKCAGSKQRDAERPESDGVVRVRREKKGRGGKTATTVNGVPGEEKDLKELAKKLKQKCGVGGSVKDWVIIIQGDQVETVMSVLEDEGYTVKKSGG